MDVKRYFGKPSIPWELIYCIVGVVFIVPATVFWLVTFGAFRMNQAFKDWADYCVHKSDPWE